MKQAWVVALLVLPVVLATGNIGISETSIVLTDTEAFFQNSMSLSSNEIGNLTLILSPKAQNIIVEIDGKRKNCLVQAEFARCGSVSAGEHSITVSYYTDYPLAEVGENTHFRYTDHLPYPAAKQKITLTLPVGYIVPRELGKDESFYISPEPKEVYSDGQRIILYWEEEGQELPVSVVTRKVIGPPIGWMAIAGISALVAALCVMYIILRRKPKVIKAKPKKKVVVPALIDNEQQVVNFLKEKGEVWQKQIQAETGFSKAKVSRVIRNLEARGVVVKQAYGNTNKISLKK